ncbi:MAG TPA: ATP-binding protein [Bacteroidetes bacterium]|nr:ATP-binding protein [Bacteroidota bacterium]
MFKSFRTNITFRLLFLIALVLALVYCAAKTEFYITMFILFVVIVLTVMDMVRYVDQTNKDFTAFLLGIKYDDFSATYSGHHKGKSFGAMYDAFNDINRKFLNIRAEKEANHQYLQTIVESVNVGLLCIDEGGGIFMMNKALQKLLNKPYLVHVDAFQQVHEGLHAAVKRIKTGERDMVKVELENKTMQLALQAAEFVLRDQKLKLISFHNIQGELEEQELDAWQKLIRILRHEIMNSIAPIVSLASTIDNMLADAPDGITDKEQSDDIRAAISAIRNRSEGLMHFTETYRNLTRLPPPKFQLVDANDLVERLRVLYQPVFEKNNIQFKTQLSQTPVIFQADVELIEQVIINIVKNAVDAIKGKEGPTISISTQRTKEGSAVIKIADNGKGIEKEKLAQVFVPFYTTKEEGSGIGLSLSRQIMRTHRGRISVQSVPGEGTVFTLRI